MNSGVGSVSVGLLPPLWFPIPAEAPPIHSPTPVWALSLGSPGQPLPFLAFSGSPPHFGPPPKIGPNPPPQKVGKKRPGLLGILENFRFLKQKRCRAPAGRSAEIVSIFGKTQNCWLISRRVVQGVGTSCSRVEVSHLQPTAAGWILLQFPRLKWNGTLPGFCAYPMASGPQVLGFGMPDLGGCFTQLPSSNFLSRVMFWHPKGGEFLLAAPASKQHRHWQNPQLPLG